MCSPPGVSEAAFISGWVSFILVSHCKFLLTSAATLNQHDYTFHCRFTCGILSILSYCLHYLSIPGVSSNQYDYLHVVIGDNECVRCPERMI